MKVEIKDIIKEANNRVTNPLIITFVVSWLLWNWELVLVLLFANFDITRKIELIKSDYANIEKSLLYPVISAIIITISGPWLMFIFKSINSFAAKFHQDLDLNISTNNQIFTANKKHKVNFENMIDSYFKIVSKKERSKWNLGVTENELMKVKNEMSETLQSLDEIYNLLEMSVNNGMKISGLQKFLKELINSIDDVNQKNLIKIYIDDLKILFDNIDQTKVGIFNNKNNMFRQISKLDDSMGFLKETLGIISEGNTPIIN